MDVHIQDHSITTFLFTGLFTGYSQAIHKFLHITACLRA